MADPDLEIRVRPGHPDSEIKGGGGGGPVLNKNSSALRASVWSTNKGKAGPPGPSPRSATVEAQYSLSRYPFDIIFCENGFNLHRSVISHQNGALSHKRNL